MHIVARPVIIEFSKIHPPAAQPLNDWYAKTKKINCNWNSFMDIKQTFNTCDFIGDDRYVFDIGGNNYRLVAMIHFRTKFVYIRGIFTHAEYDQMWKKGRLKTL